MSLKAVETLSLEVLSEGVPDYERTMKKLAASDAGTERHRSLLCDLSVAAWELEGKAKIAREAIDEYLDSLPDEKD